MSPQGCSLVDVKRWPLFSNQVMRKEHEHHKVSTCSPSEISVSARLTKGDNKATGRIDYSNSATVMCKKKRIIICFNRDVFQPPS